LQIKANGATPIEKNIIVVDEQGNEHEATYPKRAKGFVKNGRARFVSENKICLACPPNEILEDNKMSDNSISKAMNQEKTEKESTIEAAEAILATRRKASDMSPVIRAGKSCTTLKENEK
jgi:hypothetical protein